MFHRRVVEEVTLVETTVWNCCSEKCLAWVRDDFKSAEVPICPICKSYG